jgi:hypothetical protein
MARDADRPSAPGRGVRAAALSGGTTRAGFVASGGADPARSQRVVAACNARMIR